MRPPFSSSSKFISFCTVLIFCWNQIVFATGTNPFELSPTQPVQSTIAEASAESDVTSSPVPANTTTDFLLNKGGPLSAVNQESIETNPELTNPSVFQNYEYERYDFQDTLDLLRPEFATAIIIKDLTIKDLESLTRLSFEVAVAVIAGEIIVFTTGNDQEVGILEPARQLLEKASFISHMHKASGPSVFDLEHAVMAPTIEYVVTPEGSCAYNSQGLVNGGDLYSLEEYLRRLNETLREEKDKDLTGVRSLLNEFIQQMDLYNEADEKERSSFRKEDIQPATPDAPHLNPEQFAASGVQNGIKDVIRTSQGRISQIKTESKVFDYIYDASGKVSKVTQSRLVTEEVSLTNLARTGTTTVSSGSSSAANAIDGVPGTGKYGWVGANTNGGNDWLRLDLGKEALVEKIKYDTRYGPVYLTSVWQRGFKIAVSVDGLTWTDVASKSGQTSSQFYEFTITPVKARYVKVYAIDSTYTAIPSWHYPYVGELEVYEKCQTVTSVIVEKEYTYIYDASGKVSKVTQSRLVTEEVSLTNLARTGTTTVSSGSSSAANAIDGVPGTGKYGWVGANTNGGNDWLRLDLGKEALVEKIKYDTRYGPVYLTSVWQRSFKIAVSVDGLTWTDVASKSGQTSSQFYEFTITPVKARYVKVYAIDSTYTAIPSWHYPYVGELEVYEKRQTVTSVIAEKEYVYTYDPGGRLAKMTEAWTDAQQLGATNLARTGTVIASSGSSSAAKAIDGVLGTGKYGWVGANANGGNDWFQLDLGKTAPVGRIQYDTRYGPSYLTSVWQQNFDISVSVDGMNWTPVVSRRGETGSKLFDFQIPIQAVRYVKVSNISSKYTADSTWHYAYVGELSLYTDIQPAPEATLLSSSLTNSSLPKLSFLVNGVSTTRSPSTLLQEGENLCSFAFNTGLNAKTTLYSRITLDTIAPAGSLNINSGASYATSRTVILNLSGTDEASGIDKMSFSTDNVTWSASEVYATTKAYTLPAGDGTKTVYVKYYDKAGNASAVYSKAIVFDTTLPTGSITINNNETSTTSRDIALALIGSDALSGVYQMRFSTDNGTNWTAWESFAASKTLTLLGDNGPKTIQYQISDKAGNISAVYSKSITLNLNISLPVVQFTSAVSVSSPDYVLSYTVNGMAQSERWQLSSGVNPLLIRIPGEPVTFERFDVTLDQSDIVVPDMPSVPTLSADLVSVTAQNGLIVKYNGSTVVSVENPGVFQLFLPQLDVNGALTDGVIQFSNGDKLLYQNSKPVLKISSTGERTVYNSTGTVASVTEPDGAKIRFSYRVNDQSKVLSVLSMDASATSLYEGGSPSRILMQDGSDIRYEEGLLSSYRDVNGNIYQYQITELQSSGTITGYRSILSTVTPAGSSSAVSFSKISSNLFQYPTIQSALNNKISTEIDYDANSQTTKFTSGIGEVLTLHHQLPESLRDASGNLKLFENTLNSAGGLSSVALMQNNIPSQVFDARGNISSLTLSDGTVFQVADNKLGAITLSDDSILTGLMWNATTRIMTDYVRTYTDGTKTTYVNSHLVRKEEPNGNVTTYTLSNGMDQPDLLTTSDGRTYRFIIYKNAQGLMDQRTELVKMVLSDGSRVELKNGKPVRYIRSEQVQLDPFSVPVLPEDRSYVASVVLPNAELRSLTIDSAGSILSGEILFNDGAQYFIENGALVKQVTADGKIAEVQSADPLPFEKPTPILPDPLTTPEINYRNELVDAQFNYFTNQLGIDADTGMPVDNYLNDTQQQSDYSQATLVGFWAEILAAIAKGDYAPSTMNQTQAFQKLESLLAELQKVQSQAGWNGMFSFFKVSKQMEPVYDEDGKQIGTNLAISYSREFDNIGMGDNLNLSVSLTSVLGALSGLMLQDSALNSARDLIVAHINSILSLQDVGYAQFYDVSVNRFHSERKFYENGSSYWTNGHMDRVFTEFLPGLVWLAARNPSYKPALDNLDVTIRPYQTQNGTQIENAVPFDGGAFQMFWPLMHVDETKYPEFNIALKNFLYAQAEFTSKNGIPGLLSAGDDPGKGYNGKIGLPAASETDDVLATNIGSLYGTAGAFLLAPHYTLQFLKNIEAKFPGIRTRAGLVDSVALKNGQAVFSNQAFGVDQASFILSLLGTSQNYFTQYLEQNGLSSNFDALYQGMSFNLAPAAATIPAPPDFGLSTPTLYTGTNSKPDGLTNALTKRSSFMSTLVDPEFGEGHIYDYLDPDGNFHDTKIEFGSESNLKTMTLAQYLLLPGRGDMSRSLFSAVSLDLLNEATNQNSFYTPGQGYANGSLVTDSIGEVRHIDFNLQQPSFPVGLYAKYTDRDLSQYDYISVPVRLGSNAPEGVSLKFEFKGMGEIFVTGKLTRDWQYFQIPVTKPAGLLQEIDVVIQSSDGGAVSGDVYLGPLSAFKVRTSSQMDWQAMLGKSDSEIRDLLRSKVLLQSMGGGTVEADEILEDFTLDSDGKLVDGVLKRADGSIQYFRNGQLMKWVFRNGRTVLFEKGLATFILELAHGQLQVGRFYYDETFRGEIQSFVVQDNDSKKVYGPDGKLQTIVESGRIIHFTNGQIDSIVLPESTLTQIVFADDQSLLRAHVQMNDGREFDIDDGGEQTIVRPNGVKVYYKGSRIVGLETSQNGKTTFTYTLNAKGQMTGVDATFGETVVDGSGNSSVVMRTLSLCDYLLRPERSLEKQEILREPPRQIIPIATIGGFSNGPLPNGEHTEGHKYYQPDGTPYGWYQFLYSSLNGTTLGMVAGNYSQPVNLANYDFIQLTVEQGPGMTWNQDFNFVLKTPTKNTLYSFELDNAPNQYKAFGFSLAGKSGSEGEITLEVIREAGGVGKIGVVNIKDISYLAIKTIDHPLWENYVSMSSSELQGLKIEADTFANVGAEVASHVPLSYGDLIPLLDMPSSISYSDKDATYLGQLVSFKRFDGAEVSVSGSDITRVVLPDGTVNEYSAQGSASQGTIRDPSASNPEVGSLNYHYGELRKITQSDGKVYELSYEFNTQGDQITLIKDDLTGDIRRFKDGKLIESASNGGVSTTYQYQNGELIGAELFYKNRVLQNSSYKFLNNETQVTDGDGTTWYYDANGNLIKHLTQDGYLYAYSDYSATPQNSQDILQDYKWANVFSATDLRAVSLIGYEAKDGMQIKKRDDNLMEIDSPVGDKAVNVVLDDERKIKSGQIQFANGLILEIGNYLPVRGRLASGALFSTNFPAGSAQTTILQDGTGAYVGSMFQIDDTYYSYDAYGSLIKASSSDGESYQLTYQRDTSGNATSYDVLHYKQADFNGVPFPEEMKIQVGNDIVLSGSNGVLEKREGNPGFIISAYDEFLNQWKVLSGKFSAEGDRILLRNFLTHLKVGQYVAAVVKDPNFSQAGDEILSLLEGIGAGQVRTASAGNQTWYLFGNEYLKKGEGREQVGGSFFSTATESITHVNLAGVDNPVFNGMNLILSVPKAAADAYAAFLKAYEPNKPSGDLENATVYNKQNKIVYSESLDGLRTFYDKGKPRETHTSGGELLYTHEYGCPAGGCSNPDDPYLAKVTLVKARLDFETESAQSRQRIEQVKFDALRQLAEQENVAQVSIKQEVAASIAALDVTISQLQDQRRKTNKTCHRGWFGIGTFCKEYTYEVPGVAGMIIEAQNQKVTLLQNIQPEQIATVPSLIAQKKLEIEAAIAQKMKDLTAQEQSVFHDILEREVAPVLADIYRRLLGRDPTTVEVDAEIARFGTMQAIDLSRTVAEIKSSSEFQSRTNDKAAIISQVQTFLNSYVAAENDPDPVALRAELVRSLRLDPSEVVNLDQEEVTAIISWLQNRDLHFGQSAFLSLKNMLSSRGINVPMVTLGYETILVDILTGTIHKFAEGDLLISVFAFERVAKIHGADIAGVNYELADLKALYASACPDLQRDKTAPCNLRVIAHVEGNHFVVITAVTGDSVTFFETNKGPTGGLIIETFDQFMKIWNTGNGTGHLVVYKDQAITEKIIDDQTAMRIRGAFFFFDDLIFWFAIASIVLTAASIVVSYISPTFGRILGYAAMVAGIVAIAASVVNFAVQGFSMALSSINSVGLLQSVQNGFTALGNAIWEGVAHVGQFLKQGFTFLTDVFTGNFSSLGAGITSISNFAMDGVKVMFDPAGALVHQNLTFGQMVGRSMIAAAVNMPVSKGLDGLGIDPRMARLAGAFVSGGIAGLGAGGTSFLQSGMQTYLLQGVSEIGLKLNLPPPITAALSIATNASLAGIFNSDFSLRVALPQIFPQFAQQLTLGGIELLGRSLGLDPRITQLIGFTTAAAVGNITGQSLGLLAGYRDDGTPIYVTNPYDTGSIWDSITGALTSQVVRAVGFNFGGIISNPIFGSLLSGNILSSVGSILGSEGLFSGILDILKTAVLAPFNVVNGIAQTVLNGIQDFGTLIQEKGLLGAFEFLATAIFSQQTIEKLLNSGGIGGFISAAAKIPATLNGQNVLEQKLDNTTSLFYDLAGNFIGKKENGVTQLGTFGFNSAGKWALLAGSFISSVIGGWAFSGEVQDGQLKRGKLYDSSGAVVGEFTPENNDGTITLDGRYPDAQQFGSSSGFWGMVFNCLPLAMDFVFSNGLLQQVNTQINSSQNTNPDKPFFVLANGVGNPSATGLPDYINNLTSDIQTESNNQITYGDIIKPPLYNALLGGGTTDQVKDILHWLAESNTPYIHLDLVGKIQLWMNAWRQVIAVRPVVGVGFSGGFEPLVESLVGTSYNVASLVSLAGIIGSLAGISTEIVNLIITVADQIESGTVNGLKGFLDTLFSKIPVVGDVVQIATSIVGFVNNHSIGLAFDTLKAALMSFLQVLPPALPPIISPSAEVLVNLYGTADILYKLNLVGAKDSVSDFMPDNPFRRLFNIEIVGATHSGYMRRDEPSLNQPAVNAFVTKLVEQSSSEEKLAAFLTGDRRVFYDASRRVWVVNP